MKEALTNLMRTFEVVLSKNSAPTRNSILGTTGITPVSRSNLRLGRGSAGIEPDQSAQFEPVWESDGRLTINRRVDVSPVDQPVPTEDGVQSGRILTAESLDTTRKLWKDHLQSYRGFTHGAGEPALSGRAG